MMFAKIRLHPLLIVFILFSLMTGTFVQLFIILTIVLIHELGHYLAAAYYKWRIDYIMLWVFGGVMKTDESTYRPVKEEIIVTLAGPLQHVVIYIILQCIAVLHIIPDVLIEQAHYYNGVLLLFNLLPIYPLDGGKMMLLLHSTFAAYYMTLKRTYIYSILFCSIAIVTQLSFYAFTWSAFALCLFLLLENIRAWQDLFFTFIRFLLSRYHTKEKRKNSVTLVDEETLLVNALKQIRRTRTHVFKVRKNTLTNHRITEHDCLHLYFYHKKITATMREVIDKNNNI